MLSPSQIPRFFLQYLYLQSKQFKFLWNVEKLDVFLKGNKVDAYLTVLKSEQQVSVLQKILNKAEFWVFKCPDKRCECFAILLLGNSYTFKNNDKTFNLKAYFTCDSFNHLYFVIYLTDGKEYTGETGTGKTKLSDCVQVYWQHVRQPDYQKFKVEEHLRACSKGTCKIIP